MRRRRNNGKAALCCQCTLLRAFSAWTFGLCCFLYRGALFAEVPSAGVVHMTYTHERGLPVVPVRPPEANAHECESTAKKHFANRPPSDFVSMFDGSRPPGPFRCCAIVGSSPILMGKKLGQEIDGFETVIRVNRIPGPQHFADFGRKTDVAFVNDRHWYKSVLPGLGWNGPDCILPGQCNFTVVLSSWQPWPERKWDEISNAWKNTSCRVGHENDAIGDGLRQYLPRKPNGREHYMPSGGFHAFFTFAPQCVWTRLFGFGGPQQAVDGHNISDFHNFHEELKTIKMVASGDAKGLQKKRDVAKKKWDLNPSWLPSFLLQLQGRIAITT